MRQSIHAIVTTMNTQDEQQHTTPSVPAPSSPVQRYPTDRASLERDSDVEFLVASGPGGQHRNKAETGVRLTHRPTGIVIMATERRSQYANREAAFERLAERLEERQRPKTPRRPTRPTAASRARRLESKRRTSNTKRQRSAPME